MGIIAKIAFRNILKDKRRSIVLGFVIFISFYVLMNSNAFMNGVERQVLKGYKNLQTADVVVIWENHKKIKPTDPERFVSITKTVSFDVAKNAENKKALDRLAVFLKANRSCIQYFFPTIRRPVQVFANEKIDTLILYSLSSDNSRLIRDTRTLDLIKGELLSNHPYGICISKEKAEKFGLDIGAIMTVETVTSYGTRNSLDFIVQGIYANRAGYDNYYGFISESAACEVFDFDPEYFDIGRIFLTDDAHAGKVSEELDAFLGGETAVLRAESYQEASTFYTRNPKSNKAFFTMFLIFLILTIGLGIHASIRMNLFKRMKEFGTIRAIGYSRVQCYALVFYEILFLSLLSFAAALVITGVMVAILNHTGIYLGSGPQTYAFGSEYVYPEMKWIDILFAFIVVILLSLLSTVKSGLSLAFQKITDTLSHRWAPVSLTKQLFKARHRCEDPGA